MSSLAPLFAVPLLLAALGLVPRLARVLPGVAAVLMLAQGAIAVWICQPAFAGATASSRWACLDGMGAAVVLITTLVAAASLVQAAMLLPAERTRHGGASDRRLCGFYTLAGLFLAAMYCVLLARDLGSLWIAMEATTLMSAPLVYYHRSRHSLEATWKYFVLCSVGIAFALFGTVVFIAAQQGLAAEATLDVAGLVERASQLDPRLLRLGFILCLLGYGTKAGLFPLHNWLPDAHSEAPAPASAMLSGALLNCALVAIWRLSRIMEAAGQGAFARQLLVAAGTLTVVAAAVLLVRQHGLKRMWAYSSVEHVGLLTLAIGIGSGPIFILHALNHSLAKVALFLLAGNLLHRYGTKSLSRLRGVLGDAPAWGMVMAAASFAIVGSPPFGTFLSEWLLLRDTLAAGSVAAGAFVLVGLTVTFIAVSAHVGRVLFGEAPDAPAERAPRAWALVPAVLVVASLAGGVALSPAVMDMLRMLAEGGAGL